jgi:two-component system osmolarity sensor histidine kinase EnvZ
VRRAGGEWLIGNNDAATNGGRGLRVQMTFPLESESRAAAASESVW